ncbi:MAG TPA: glycosyltransferase [Chloroflexota bacterium]|nr:glycosyltransferase [Chloroflexota bacterium]
MRHVVMLSPDFPPSGMPPATRARLFARHLPGYGWKPTVITTDPAHFAWDVDEENLRLVPPDLTVVRTGALPLRLTRFAGFGDIGIRTFWHQWHTLHSLMAGGGVDCLLVSVPSNYTMLLARLAHARYGIPYVVDYMDPWVSGSQCRLSGAHQNWKAALSDVAARSLEPLALRGVAHIVGVSAGTTRGLLQRYPWLSSGVISEIPFGAEPSDLDYVRAHPRRNAIFDPSDGCTHISYVGACIPQMYESVCSIFAAVRLGLRRNPDRFGRVRLHFVGSSYDPRARQGRQILELARRAGVADIVDETPTRVPYLDSLQLLLDSHILLLIGSDAPHYTASKIFPCILARRPLLAVFHRESTVCSILRETGAGAVVAFGARREPAAEAGRLAEELDRILALGAETPPPTDWEAFGRYSARAMTGRLASALDRAVAARTETPEVLSA